MSVDFSQLTNFLRGLERAAINVEADLKAAAGRRARAVQAAAQSRLPRKGDTPYATGMMREHVVVVEDEARRQFRVEVEDIPGRDPLVPVYHEFGTVGTAAKPFLRPAVDENRDSYIADAERAVAQRLSEAG
jgi:HK97 gp10 family phage protein